MGAGRSVCAAAALALALLAAGCDGRDVTGEAFSAGNVFEYGDSGNRPAVVTRRPADVGDDVALFWYWVSGYVSAEGAEEDIRAFAREGFGRVVINEIELPAICGSVRHATMSDVWWETLRAALAAAEEENVELGITVCPGLGSRWPFMAGTGAWSSAAEGETAAAVAERHFSSYVGEILRRVPAGKRRALRFVVAGDVPSGAADAGAADEAAWRAGYMRRMTELCRAEGLAAVSRDVRAALLCGADAAGDGLLASARFVPDGAVDDSRVAASAARLCGMRSVAAEVGDIETKAYAAVPSSLKRAADMAYVQGVNAVVPTGAVLQATATDMPGLNTWLFSDIDRNVPWFTHADMLVDYLWRCNMMLSRGERVTDVAVPFAGGDAFRTVDIVAEAGYDADYIPLSALSAAEVRDGAVVTGGCSYAAVVCGRVLDADAERVVAALADRGARIVRTSLSSLDRRSMKEALAAVAAPDVSLVSDDVADYSPLRYTHRSEEGRDVYFLFNASSEPLSGRLSLRCAGGAPELWNPVDGMRSAVAEFSAAGGRTSFDISLAGGESIFAVAGGGDADAAARRRVGGYPFEYRWDVSFSSPVSEPFSTTMYDLRNLSENDERRIRFFSGRTTYSSLFEVRKPVGCDRVELVMREAGTSAKVWINDRYVGGMWTRPYRIDVTDAVRNGMNSIRIETAGTWVNAIVGMMTALSEGGAPAAEEGAAAVQTERDSLTDKGWRMPQLHFVVNTYTERSELPVSGMASGVSLIYYGR